jgi:hypothetical protein
VSLLVLAGFALVFSLLFKIKARDRWNTGHAHHGTVYRAGSWSYSVTQTKWYKGLLTKCPVSLTGDTGHHMWLFVFYATGLTIIVSFFMVLGSGLIHVFYFGKNAKPMAI